MTPNCQIHPVPATGTCNNCRAFTCDKCAKLGRTCPYCKLAPIVAAGEARKAVNQCSNHPGIRAAATCPDCNRIFCASCLNPFGQCLECGARNPRQKPTVAPLQDSEDAPGARRGKGKGAGKLGRPKPKKNHFGVGRLAIGALILIGIGAVLNWQYQTLKAAVPGNKGQAGGLGAVGANVGAYNRQVEAHGKDLNDIMGRIESGQYSEDDAAAVDDLMNRVQSGQANLNSFDVGTQQKLKKAKSLLDTGASYQARGEEYAGEDTGGGAARSYKGPPIRLRVGSGERPDRAGARAGAEYQTAYKPKPLKVDIMSPSSGARVRGTTVVSARLTGDGIDRVEFQVNGQWQGLSNQPPYRYEWDSTSVRNGAVTLRVVAYDSSGRPHASRPVRVTVHN